MAHRVAMGVTGTLARVAGERNIGRDDGMRRPADQVGRINVAGG